MPYIKYEDRVDLELDPLRRVRTAGELNYAFTRLLLGLELTNLGDQVRTLIGNYIEDKGLNYQAINDIAGAVLNCSKEYDRRVGSDLSIQQEVAFKVLYDEYTYFYDQIGAPYEDEKIKENGDVY